MTRAPYLVALVNFLKNSTILNNHGLAGVPDLKNQNIYVDAEWDDDKDTSTYGSALVIIEPLDGDNLDFDDRRGDCMNEFEHELKVYTQVQNARASQEGLQSSQVGTATTYTGAYVDAQKLEELVRKTILAFNASYTTYPGWSNLILKQTIRAQLEENGFLVLTQLYSTKYMF